MQSYHRRTKYANSVSDKEFLDQLSDCQLQGKMELGQCTQFTKFFAPTKCTVSNIDKYKHKCMNINI